MPDPQVAFDLFPGRARGLDRALAQAAVTGGLGEVMTVDSLRTPTINVSWGNMRASIALLAIAVAALSSCERGTAADSGAGKAGLATTFDSTADTVYARVQGLVPETAVRRLIEVMRIAPAAEDTSLFTEVYEFDVDRRGRVLVYDPTSPRQESSAPARRSRRSSPPPTAWSPTAPDRFT